MGMMTGLMSLLFGGGRNAIAQTVEVFRENAESGAQRGFALQNAALSQLAAEFALPRKGGFDRFMDGLNRVPRPALVFGILAMFVAAMADPVWFAARMAGLSLVPEPLWWLLGIIVSFYFGARHQVKGQEFQQALAETYSRVPGVMGHLSELATLDAPARAAPEMAPDITPDSNPALSAWQQGAG